MSGILRLKCSDEKTFCISEDSGRQSVVMKEMLENTAGNSDDPNDNELQLADNIGSEEMNSVVLLMTSSSFDEQQKTLESISIVKLLNVVVAINYLDIPPLLQLTCKEIAKRVNLRTSSMINDIFSGIAKFSGSIDMKYNQAYSGEDINLIDYSICYNYECEEEEEDIKTGEVKVFKCSRCGLIKYCSKRCQKKDYSEHKKDCLEIKRIQTNMEKLRTDLINHDEGFGRRTDYFQEYMGHFWGTHEPRDYCRKIQELAECVSSIAHDRETKELYTLVLKYYLDLLRLTSNDNQGIRYQVPFVLITLNRDEDTFKFIKFWEVVREVDGYIENEWDVGNWEDLPDGSIYDDLFAMLGEKIFIDLTFLVALTLIKLRIVAKHNQKEIQYITLKENIQQLSSSNTGLLDVLPVLKQHIIGDKDWIELMQKQEMQLDKYLNEIMKQNKTFLPAVVNPEPLKKLSHPDYMSRGSVEEAWLCLNYSCRIFHRIPGAILKIQGLVGKNPTYDASYKFD